MGIGIFEPKVEKIILWLPVALLAIAVGELTLFGNLANEVDPYHMLLLSNVLFFNVTHTPLTFLMISNLPELQEWIKNKRCLVFEIAFVFSCIFLVFFLSVYALQSSLQLRDKMNFLVRILLLTVPFFHTHCQFHGLSLCYNQALKQRFDLKLSGERAIRSEKMEKSGFFSFYIFAVILNGAIIYKIDAVWQNLLWAATLGSLAWLFVGALLYPKAFKSNKPLFLIRVVAPLMMPYTAFAIAAASVAHGTEYVAVYFQMGGKSKSQSFRQIMPYLTAAVLLGFGSVYALNEYLVKNLKTSGEPYPLVSALVHALVYSIIFSHYYTDRILFRMRERTTRELVSPLLARS